MAENKDLKVDELNFDLIKANFKNYLQFQDNFRDYNFEGSGINTLLDLLAYNTYYNSFYLNMASAEAFLTTAQKRNSVISLAKSLNYTPRSVTSARISGVATLTVTGSPTSVIIPQHTEFTGSIDGTTYKFLTTEAFTINSSAGIYRDLINLIEGTVITRRYIVSAIDSDQRFIIPNLNVDTSTLSVNVLNSSSDSTSRTFIKTDNIVEVTSTSQVFFLEEVEDGQFEVKFGDGSFGVALDPGNVVILEYIVSSGADANDIQSLTYADSISGVTTISFSASDSASGGAVRESINSIKFNAPKSYQAQNRIVTTEDYRTLLLQQSSVDSVVIWGGEDNDPPRYGTVFIAVKPTTGNALTATEKQNIINTVIKPKKILTVQTEIIDPEYLYLLIDATVKYDSKKTTLTSAELESIIDTTIQNYNDDDIDAFLKYFRYSKLSRLIDFADRSILNNTLSVRMRREVDVQLGVSARYEINFSNAIDASTDGRPALHPYGAGNKLSSNEFTYSGFTRCFLEENNGILRIYSSETGTNLAVVNNAGTLNYATGVVILTGFAPTTFADGSNTLKLTAFPAEKDILPLRNQIIQIRDADITVSMIDDNSISLVNR